MPRNTVLLISCDLNNAFAYAIVMLFPLGQLYTLKKAQNRLALA